MKTFHNASLESPRLKKLHAFLRQRGRTGATSIEISEVCCTPRSASDVSELRANKVPVLCRHESTTDEGRKIYRYILEEFIPTELAL